MRYLIAALLLSSSFTSTMAQSVAYVGDMGSIDRELLESSTLQSPKLPAPLAQHPVTERSMAGQQAPAGFPSQTQVDPYVEQVKYTRAANVKQSASKEAPAKKSSFFRKMKPTWLFGEEKQMETPAQKDPFLAAQPRLSASPIQTQAGINNQVSNAGFDQQSNQARPTTKPNSMARSGGIAMRPPTKPKGLFNHLGLMGESKTAAPSNAQSYAPSKVTAKPAAKKQTASTPPASSPRPLNITNSSTVANSISNPFVKSNQLQSNQARTMQVQPKTISKPQVSESKPRFVTDKKSLSLSSATDGVKGFEAPSQAKKPAQVIEPMSIASDADQTTKPSVETPSKEEFYFVSDDDLIASDKEQKVVEVELPAMPAVETPLTEQSLPEVIEPNVVEITTSTPSLVSPTESSDLVDETVEMAELPTPKPFIEANSDGMTTTPMVMPTQNPFAKTRPIADSSKQPSERSRVLLSEAHSLAEHAASREEFTSIIQRCRYVLAIDDAQQAVDYANELAGWGLNKRGELLLDQGRNAEARVDFNDAINCDRNCWRAEHNLGVIKAQSGDYLIAKRHFDRTLQLNPEFAKAYANRAALLIQSSNYQEALADYQRAIEVDPDLAMAHAGRGRICHMFGNLAQALRHLDAAELLSPNDAMISLGRGDLLVDLGRYGQARQAYEQAIMLAPEQPNAYRNLAWMLATCPSETFRNGEEALANAQLALELTNNPDDIALDTHAAALAAVGRFEEAIPMLKEAIKMAPEADAEVYSERLAMYEQGKAFTSVPVGLLKQATYISDKNQSSSKR